MEQNSDRNLIDAHISGQADAFETLVGRYGPSVLGYLTKMTRNRQQAEDLFQETFQRVHTHAGQFKGECLKPWIFQIATHTAISDFRKAQKHPAVSLSQPLPCADGEHCPTLESTLESPTPEPIETLNLEEKRRQVKESLLKLPEKQRSALILSYYHKLSYKEIAEAMNCSIGTVKTHLFRALKKLATLLPNPAGGVE